MQLSTILAVVSFVSSACAQTAVSTIHTITANLESTLPVYENAAISNAEIIAGAVTADAAVAAEAALNANLTAIVTALVSAGTQIAGATVNAAGGITNATVGLAQADINTLSTDVEIIVTLVEGIEATYNVIVKLGGNVQATAGAELVALQNVIAPFAAPLQAYVAGVLTSYVNATVSVTGLANAQADLIAVVNSVTATIGI
ncbi:hypothetical protein BD289DRAFT_476194 [Coniella lustricola]|uniref:Hydrophobic surface binding protein A-domain-containing protein n=1 Tax=Coniella lustricola TaxID=2025994 RepID=A0A2T2ZZT7_9PEZI|nr:hypothetical protein BD289DRAFT_476194 [Coniella lustricola]